MEVPEQKLPMMEPGHVAPQQKLPRVEGAGAKDDVPTSDYPKHVTHPYGGTLIASSAEHEAQMLESFAELPPAPAPADHDRTVSEMEKRLGRKLVDSEKAFMVEVQAAYAKIDLDESFDYKDEVSGASLMSIANAGDTAGDAAAPVEEVPVVPVVEPVADPAPVDSSEV